MIPNDRGPVIPLPYELREIAVEHELIIDYDRGKIFIVVKKGDLVEPGGGSETTGSGDIIYDFTQTIIDEILKNELDSGRLSVWIEGLGEVNLEKFLSMLYLKQLDVTDSANKTMVPKDFVYDMLSISLKDYRVQMKDFDVAEKGSIARKSKTGALEWVLLSEDGQAVPANGTEHGDIEKVVRIPDIGYELVSDKVQISENVSWAAKVVLPPVGTDYCKIKWKFETGLNPVLEFPDNIIWEYENSSMLAANATHIFEFETWDRGVTWYGHSTRFGSTLTDEPVTVAYLKANYYDKEQVNDIASWDTTKIPIDPEPEGSI